MFLIDLAAFVAMMPNLTFDGFYNVESEYNQSVSYAYSQWRGKNIICLVDENLRGMCEFSYQTRAQ